MQYMKKKTENEQVHDNPIPLQINRLLQSTKASSDMIKAGLLARNILPALPIPFMRNSGHKIGKTGCVTYSCGTACELHTIPFSSRFGVNPYHLDKEI